MNVRWMIYGFTLHQRLGSNIYQLLYLCNVKMSHTFFFTAETSKCLIYSKFRGQQLCSEKEHKVGVTRDKRVLCVCPLSRMHTDTGGGWRPVQAQCGGVCVSVTGLPVLLFLTVGHHGADTHSSQGWLMLLVRLWTPRAMLLIGELKVPFKSLTTWVWRNKARLGHPRRYETCQKAWTGSALNAT